MENVTKSELPACPVETTLTLISDKWKVLILRDLLPGTKRFGELRKSIGQVSQKVLTAQLRQMEESGLVHRQVYPEVHAENIAEHSKISQLIPVLPESSYFHKGHQIIPVSTLYLYCSSILL